MLISEPTAQMLNDWTKIYKEYKDKIKPCKKSGNDICEYLENKYVLLPIKTINGEDLSTILSEQIKNDDYYSWRLPVGKKPDIKAFMVENKGEGKNLYDCQEDMFKGLEIIVAVDLITGCCHIENSGLLYDEIVAFQGLDEIDLTNYFKVAEYVQCRKKFGLKI